MSRYFPQAAKKRKARSDKKTAAELRRAGSWLAKVREREEKGGEREPLAWHREFPPAVHVTEITDQLLRSIPGYDPFDGAAGFTFSPSRACKAINWIQQRCTHIKGSLGGQAFVLSPIQRCIVANLFGWLREDGTRRYRRLFLYVARKFGKTLFGAAVLLYCLLEDGEIGAEVYCAAGTRDQAKLLWVPAKGMVRNDRYLADRLKVYQHSIVRLSRRTGNADNSFFQAISAEANSAHGFNPHAFVLDEVHTQPDAELRDVLDTGTGSREQALELDITTADFARESLCNEILDYARKVRDGVLEDPEFLPVIFEADPADDWEQESTWLKANPHFPVTPTRAYMESRVRRAKESPAYRNTFLRLNCNIVTNADVAAFRMEDWDACAGTVEPEGPAYWGLDLGQTHDLTAFVGYWPRVRLLKAWFWLPESAMTVAKDHRALQQFVGAGLELTPGNVCDYDYVESRILQIVEGHDNQSAGYDPWSATQMALNLQGKGLTMVEMRQGYATLNGPSQELNRLVVGHELRHGGDRLLRYCASNLMWRTDPNENIAPNKQKSTGRIDGIVAGIMAIGRAIVSNNQTSVYAERGLLVF